MRRIANWLSCLAPVARSPEFCQYRYRSGIQLRVIPLELIECNIVDQLQRRTLALDPAPLANLLRRQDFPLNLSCEIDFGEDWATLVNALLGELALATFSKECE